MPARKRPHMTRPTSGATSSPGRAHGGDAADVGATRSNVEGSEQARRRRRDLLVPEAAPPYMLCSPSTNSLCYFLPWENKQLGHCDPGGGSSGLQGGGERTRRRFQIWLRWCRRCPVRRDRLRGGAVSLLRPWSRDMDPPMV
jgi:hypothetical protein